MEHEQIAIDLCKGCYLINIEDWYYRELVRDSNWTIRSRMKDCMNFPKSCPRLLEFTVLKHDEKNQRETS